MDLSKFTLAATPGLKKAAVFRRVALALLVILCGTRAMAQVPDIQIEQPAGSIVPDGSGLVNFGQVSVGSEASLTFTIRNTGTATLSVFGTSTTGPNSGDYIAGGAGASLLTPTGTTTFTVRFSPGSIGSKTATLQVTSNDPNESPYDINLTGLATPVGVPEISVSAGGGPLDDGVSTVNFGNVRVGTTARRTFSISNTGTGTLSGLNVTFSGGGGRFQAQGLSVTFLGSGATTFFDVTFSPTSEVLSSATMQISSNDADENPFDVPLRGTGAIPLMEVEQPAGTLLNDNSSTIDFGTTDPGVPAVVTFTLRNSSSGELTGLALSVDGNHPGDFIPGALAPTLAMGSSTTFTVAFNPAAAGDRSAKLHISSTQTGTENFDINVRGVGAALSDLGDADGDGTVNLMEDATANDPRTAGPPPGTIAMSGNNLEFTFTKSHAYLFQVYYIVEWSDDLANWNGTPDANSTIVSDDGVVQVVKYSLAAGAGGKRFMRLRVMRI